VFLDQHYICFPA